MSKPLWGALPVIDQETPIVRLFADERGNELWVKRDDLLPFCFGGNKLRIALCYLDDMRAQGANHMLVYGNARSNLCRVMANLCGAVGLGCTILSPADDDGQRRASYNQLLARSFGARVVPCLKSDVAQSVERAMLLIEAAGETPYYIYGDKLGHGRESVPVAAYARVYPELLRQERALGRSFDILALATGTGTTQAGLCCGRALAGDKRRVVGFSVARSAEAARGYVAAYARSYLQSVSAPVSIDADEVEVVDRYALSYGLSDEGIRRTIREAMLRFGLPLDETYTGKAFHALRQWLADEDIRGQRVLFWHTGGTPLYFDALAGEHDKEGSRL